MDTARRPPTTRGVETRIARRKNMLLFVDAVRWLTTTDVGCACLFKIEQVSLAIILKPRSLLFWGERYNQPHTHTHRNICPGKISVHGPVMLGVVVTGSTPCSV